MITLQQIQNKLAEALKNSGMTQTALSKILGIRQQTISHYIKGDIMPALDTFANLCAVLDLDANDILCVDKCNISNSFNNNNGSIHIGNHYNISGNNNKIK